jgi:thiamine biosynthesis protein ThiI
LEDVVLVRYSEIAVKGPATRARMESLLKLNIEDALSRRGATGRIELIQGRLIIRKPSPDSESVARIAARVFGVKSVSPAVEVRFDNLEDLVSKAVEWFAPRAKGKIFRVRARRVGIHDFTSKDVERELGAKLVQAGAGPVNLENPEYTAYVEVRGNRAFFYDEIIEGPGGLPLGSEAPTLVLFSGGFDSTATAWLLMRRGSKVALAFYDLGVEEAFRITLEAALKLSEEWIHGHGLRFYRILFDDVVSRARQLVRPEYRVLVVRRAMLLHAQWLAFREGYEALATGDCIGQVASQTIRNIRVISEGLDLPVLRPVSGFDKDEVVNLVRRIGLYDIVSRQIEVCGMASTPTPKADIETFRIEYAKMRFEPEEVEVRSTILRDKNFDEVLKDLGG